MSMCNGKWLHSASMLMQFMVIGLVIGACSQGAIRPDPTTVDDRGNRPSAARNEDSSASAIRVAASDSSEPQRADSSSPVNVLIVSFDGLRPDAITPETAPTLTRLIEWGSSQLSALAEFPAITLPNHSSMVTGLSILHHGVILNSEQPGRISSTTIFDVAKAAGLTAGFFATKPKLAYLCNDRDVTVRIIDANLESLAEKAAAALRANDLRLALVHFGEPDGGGHAHGWMSPEYLQQVTRADTALSRILTALDEAGRRERTVVIVSADHGGHGKIHGFDIPEDRLIPFIMQGPGVAQGRKLCSQIRTMDTAATALQLLGLPVESAKDGLPVVEAGVDVEQIPCEQPMPMWGLLCGPMPPVLLMPMWATLHFCRKRFVSSTGMCRLDAPRKF